MKIEVLDMSGLHWSVDGWRRSRDLADRPMVSEVVKVDVPVNELPSAVISFEGMTIIEREILASPRNHVMWARTSHVDDPLEFTVPADLAAAAGQGFLDDCRRLMREGKARGQSQDEWRVFLPAVSETAFTMRWNFRDLVKMAEYFNYLSGRQKHVALSARFNEVFKRLCDVLDEFTCSAQMTMEIMDSYSKAKYLHEGMLPLRESIRHEGAMFLLQFSVPLWLRAQIVRHRNLTFADEFYRQVLDQPGVLRTTLGEPILMDIAVTKDVWRSIMSKRSCWIAQDSLRTGKDAWQELIESFGWTPEMLPCADGHCPYARDAGLRLTPADPGAPCPRYLTIMEIDHAPYRDRMVEGLASRHAYWRDQVK